MVEFSENLSRRLEGIPAKAQRVYYRLCVRKDEVPYFNRGLDVQEFSPNSNLDASIRQVLSDFDTSVVISGGRVTVADIQINLPRSLSV